MQTNHNINILVVDDEPVAAIILKEFLSTLDYNVTSADSGFSALEKLEKIPTDILLTDIMMPKMSGLELAKQALELYPDIIMVAITAAGTVQTAVEFMKIGGFDFIRKPFEASNMEKVVQKAVRHLILKKELKASNEKLIQKNKELEAEITKREVAQASLEISNDNLKSIFDAMNDFVFILNTNGCVLQANPVVCEQLGFSNEELSGMNILELHAPQRLESISAIVVGIFEGNATLFSGQLIKKNGRRIEVETKISNGKWNNQTVLIAVSRDVTEYKRVQRNMEAIIEAFRKGEVDAIIRQQEVLLVRPETQVKQTESDLLESKEKQEFLKNLNTSKDRFFSIIGHDLRGMFNALKVSTDMLVKIAVKEKSTVMAKFANSAKKSTENAYELLENLLTWSRCQRGIDVVSGEFDIHKLVSKNIQLFSERAHQKKISLTQMIPPKLYVYADKNITNTILRNLIANALKFTYPGGFVQIIAKEVEGYVHVSVCDNGTGIDVDIVEKLFSIDSKHKQKGTENEQGTGLGLIMCKELSQKNNGDIWVTSEPDKGSTFTFSLQVKGAGDII
jgi:PAS domain S-box-containing protein